jgi:hypothetical protein
MAKKYHQAVRGEFAGNVFVTSLCDAGRSGERLVADIYDAPRDLRCQACASRIPWGQDTPVALIDASTVREAN